MAFTPTQTSQVALLLRRAGFGPTGLQIDQAASEGFSASVDNLLNYSSGDPADLVQPPQGMTWFPPGLIDGKGSKSPSTVASKREFVKSQMTSASDLVLWWLERMRTTTNPLREKLTLNLHNNFATAISKVQLPLLMYNQNQTIRSMSNGSFEELTQALGKDPAMMIWLDTETDKANHPNENFARELMERFTMGVGNYTQQDVEEAARAFTGWTLNPQDGSYMFEPTQFDPTSKTYLGQTGNFTGEDIIHLATNSQASHNWVTSRLWSMFAYPISTSDPIVTNDLAPAYSSNLNISDLIHTIFTHPNFVSQNSLQGLVKQPVEWLVGMYQALNLKFLNPPNLVTLGSAIATESNKASRLATATVHDLGQVPFDPPNVGGWPQNQYWLSTASSLFRWKYGSIAVKLGDNSMVEGTSPQGRPDAAAQLLGIDGGWSKSSLEALNAVSSDPAQVTSLALISPEYVSN